MKQTPYRRERLTLALTELPHFCVVFWTLLLGLAAYTSLFRLFLRASRSFPFRLFVLNAVASGCIQLLMNPEPNWVRFAITQASGLAVAVTYYSLQHIRRGLTGVAGGGNR